MASASATPSVVEPSLAERLDGYVERAQTAATSFRRLDQEQVDRIVWAMVVAGLRNAVELAQLAM
jgi:acetaldehyde dehydrogenase / alcohol dehydrogenase